MKNILTLLGEFQQCQIISHPKEGTETKELDISF